MHQSSVISCVKLVDVLQYKIRGSCITVKAMQRCRNTLTSTTFLTAYILLRTNGTCSTLLYRRQKNSEWPPTYMPGTMLAAVHELQLIYLPLESFITRLRWNALGDATARIVKIVLTVLRDSKTARPTADIQMTPKWWQNADSIDVSSG